MFDTLTDFTPLTDMAALQPPLRRLHDYWQGKRKPGALPGRRDIDPIEIPQLMPQVALVDILREPLDYRYRLFGTRLVEVMGAERTGKRMREVMNPAAIAATERLLAGLIATREPIAFAGRLFWLDKEFIRFETLVLPLAADGETVDMAVMGLEFDLPRG